MFHFLHNIVALPLCLSLRPLLTQECINHIKLAKFGYYFKKKILLVLFEDFSFFFLLQEENKCEHIKFQSLMFLHSSFIQKIQIKTIFVCIVILIFLKMKWYFNEFVLSEWQAKQMDKFTVLERVQNKPGKDIKENKIPIIFLFGDNEKDKTRNTKTEQRLGTYGQASVAGKVGFENEVCCGIVTMWHFVCTCACTYILLLSLCPLTCHNQTNRQKN
ncbi:hypothetical protein RFI_20226 [Reticulomyxa filosa]|uniref:Uncharacterized protein n=1 Tax=Reticulomyxa filosa TaxID=46433 RepID=X6MTD0_RETFI|nr:hypothetical protein RFI_20226 [Reticulomyxa filosa]|eukprot:ETO17109.1 hypothetical protein RFI_20226 [Reticulomyxa filosa]